MLLLQGLMAQQPVKGQVRDALSGEPVPAALLEGRDGRKLTADVHGRFSLQAQKGDTILVSAIGYIAREIRLTDPFLLLLEPVRKELDAVVVSGTLRPVSKLESPVPVEVYTPQFLKKNPAPSLFESLQHINGVRPQLNCNVCNTGDIHINGLEGPYTMVTIDGMPIVSSLSSVYGLFGIPSQLIERVEVVKGPASGLYGSEAIGGLINVITRSPEKAPAITGSLMSSTWNEHNLDLGLKFRAGKKINALLGVNYFIYDKPIDKNGDGFTDLTLQHRISVFNKLRFSRRHNRTASLAARYFYEDRWGGDMRWNKNFRGGDSLYGESIYTSRWELIGNYQLPVAEKMFFSFSATGHDQDSRYGQVKYLANQRILFGQYTWEKEAGGGHQLLGGLASRSNYYDDNSTATLDTLSRQNRPDRFWIPGLFVQDEWKMDRKHLLLLGLRIDHHPVHKTIFTPRIAWKWAPRDQEVFRLNAGTGFRVVSLFTEEHAALTGARAVEVLENLDPEKSWNINLNYTRYFRLKSFSLNIDAAVWYSRFSNQILADYDTDPNKIIYKNLEGFSRSTGFSLNLEMNAANRFKGMMGLTIQDVSKTETVQGIKSTQRQVLTEKWSGTWSLSYSFPARGLSVDYTGNIYGPMRLPLLSPFDPRPGQSPVWSIQNLQCTKILPGGFEVFAGIKNLLNWTPARSTPFLIARSHDPFDKQVQYDAAGQVVRNSENPYGLTFDPTYAYAPNQGRRGFAGIRMRVR